MQKRLILDTEHLEVTLRRLSQQLIENHGDFAQSAIIGLQPRGIFLANRLRDILGHQLGKAVLTGYLDTTFHRDDFRRRDTPPKAYETQVPFLIEGKKIILVDDVLYTGRTIRAALDAMITFGRPQKVDLLILINRIHSRELPIEPDYTGKNVNTLHTQKVLVEWQEQGAEQDRIWLVDKTKENV
ncbi:MAG: bifunctional pyr operon transcriptional regulator/uracil phosphoribosyltransferase PyrR [Cytophagales bacterium]|nr:bifunctional pyr operon transcriptional regulator/uracil phosphoribosyltransferase PyrR [Cytophagales bacterium]